jgi:hypothetical protein
MDKNMAKKWLNKAVDRGFRLAGHALMRQAIARLIHVDDKSLSKSGLSRAAIADFLTTPLRTDPHRFFRHRHARDTAAERPATRARAPITDLNDRRRELDGRDANRLQTDVADTSPWSIARRIKARTGLRFRVLTTGALIGLGALTACSGTALESGTASAKREQSPRCRLKSSAVLISAQTADPQQRRLTLQVAITDSKRLQQQHDARDGPSEDGA